VDAKHLFGGLLRTEVEFDQDLGSTGLEDWAGFKGHSSMRIVSLSLFRIVNIGRRFTPG
jgi:hypothetical protein